MNKCCIIGRLTKDIETRTTQTGVNCAQFTVAVDRRFKDANGNRQADFINCVAWRQTADFLSKYFKKGSKVGIVGSIQTRNYDDKNGNKVYVTEVLAEEAYFVDGSKSQTPAPTPVPVAPQTPVVQTPVAPSIDDATEDMGLPFELF